MELRGSSAQGSILTDVALAVHDLNRAPTAPIVTAG
jgi:hypothetical protein